MKFIVVSMFTANSIYEDIVDNLEKSMKDLNLEYKIYCIPEQGSWEKNCQQKVFVLRDALRKYQKPVVWVDADAEFSRYPDLFDQLKCDFAYYYFDTHREVLSGTLYLANNRKVTELLDAWIKINSTNNEWDQRNLKSLILGSFKDKLNYYRLPVEYCKIFDNKHQKANNPVITHYQASRTVKYGSEYRKPR